LEVATHHPNTKQLLDKTPNVPCLYRHRLNDRHYAAKKSAGKRKEHSGEITGASQFLANPPSARQG
jgi:bisphosphoglycerate-dependent phosphoglycerate mutase